MTLVCAAIVAVLIYMGIHSLTGNIALGIFIALIATALTIFLGIFIDEILKRNEKEHKQFLNSLDRGN